MGNCVKRKSGRRKHGVLDVAHTAIAAFARERSCVWVGKSTTGFLKPSLKVLASRSDVDAREINMLE